MRDMIRLFVGLGNPGAEYETTRHNAGFWWVDALARELKAPLSYDKSYFGQVARTSPRGQPVWLLKPQTFMNLSGKSVAALARFFKLEPHEILVAHDELDIVPGQMKLKFGGSHAGHNGLRDIHAQLGTGDYWRLRLGIGHPGVKSEVIHWVLKKPSAEHMVLIEQSIVRSLSAVPTLLSGEMEKATMLLHTSVPPRPKPVRPGALASGPNDAAGASIAPTPSAATTTKPPADSPPIGKPEN
jgi:peptidyl-tRNA hydrolase, PTH1 family